MVMNKLIRQAKNLYKQGDYYAAGQTYEEADDYKNALSAYEKGSHLAEMGRMLDKLNRDDEAIEIYQRLGEHRKLADLYVKQNNVEMAGMTLERNNRFQEAAELYYRFERYQKAAHIYETRGHFLKAAYVYEREGNLERAALNFSRCFLANTAATSDPKEAKRWESELLKAVELYIKLDKFDTAVELLQDTHKAGMAAELALKQGKLEEAAKLYKKVRQPLKAAEIFKKLGKPQEACLLMGEDALARDDREAAAEWFKKGEDHLRAAQCYEARQNFEKAAYCYFLGKRFKPSAENYLKAGKEEQAARVLEQGEEWTGAAGLYHRLKNFHRAAQLYEKAGDFFNAGSCYLEAGETACALAAFRHIGPGSPQYQDALTHITSIFFYAGKYAAVIESARKIIGKQRISLSNLELFYLVAKAFENVKEHKKALDIYEGISRWNPSYRDVPKRVKKVETFCPRPADMELAEKISSNRYKLSGKIGQGGMGKVYLAQDVQLGRQVALKFLDVGTIKDQQAQDDFYKKILDTAALSYENIVPIYEIGRADAYYYITMEYIDGKNLLELIEEKKNLALPLVLFTAIKVLKALAYAHKKGIIHRDIKPQNIMLNRRKEVRVLDFGIAYARGEFQKGAVEFLAGTPNYMSPEQIQGKTVDLRTDIYSTGATLFHLVTGRLPFTGDNIFYQHLYEPIPPVTSFRPETPNTLGSIIEKAMDKDREKRYQTADDLLTDIRSVAALFIK